MRPALLLALLASCACACAHTRGGEAAGLDVVEVGDAVFHVRYGPQDAEAARQVEAALGRAVAAARRWGPLSAAVVVTIHPTHDALEAAARREGHTWLRAWARYDSVELQSPRTWSRGRASDRQVAQLLAHELTHCVMYQSAAGERDWVQRGIPLWFREGMASVTAGERRDEDASGREHEDALGATEALDRSDPERVYDTAHRAFGYLLERYGEERVRRILGAMARGEPFTEAFRAATGVPVRDFEGDFRSRAVQKSRRG